MSVVVPVDGDISIYRAGFYTKDVVENHHKKIPPPTITASRGHHPKNKQYRIVKVFSYTYTTTFTICG